MVATLIQEELVQLVIGQFAGLHAQFPELRLKVAEDGSVQIVGRLAFSAEHGGIEIKDAYDVLLRVPSDYPRRIPSVFETGGRISEDHHKYDDGSLCLGVPLDLRRRFAANLTLLRFVEEAVVPYLYAYSYVEQRGEMPFGEWSHGLRGILDFYRSEFSTEDDLIVLGLLRILADDDYRGHQPCPCGSGHRLRNCHGHKLRELQALQSPDGFLLEYLDAGNMIAGSGIQIPPESISKRVTKYLKEKHHEI
ncbi:MAG TPA: SEC-C domain-containing protein [candidate division Zixibacteria bacterium]|nr:SEC-C domain-containing protein [candidate division Zixibacteria bacterium]MDD4918010.1 SEC-C domain-containing protein [candidate division Zixibacteria bacterium]MDM7972438.1 SEC-C domain-containing protein [candidate division Zixibacteria bacterium]HPM38249.1 SEC-C domain-containing protein [candidate division Zixibacteria bacterium]